MKARWFRSERKQRESGVMGKETRGCVSNAGVRHALCVCVYWIMC